MTSQQRIMTSELAAGAVNLVNERLLFQDVLPTLHQWMIEDQTFHDVLLRPADKLREPISPCSSFSGYEPEHLNWSANHHPAVVVKRLLTKRWYRQKDAAIIHKPASSAA